MRCSATSLAAAAAALSALLALGADAQTVRRETMARTARAADVYMNAHRAQSLSDGSRFVIYRQPVPAEASALAAAWITPDGAVTRTAAADWVAREEIAPGTLGQIYAAAMSTDAKTLAVSIGWRHPENGGTNAVAVLRRSAGNWRLSHLIRGLSATGDLLLTDSGLLLALTADRRRAEANGTTPPLLTVLSLDGRVLLEAFPTASADPDPTHRNRSRLGRSKGAYTLFDTERGQASLFDLKEAARPRTSEPKGRNVAVAYASKPAVELQMLRTIALADLASPSPGDAIVEDAHVYPDGTVAVVHSMRPRDHAGVSTLVTLQSPDGTSRSWHPNGVFFKPVFWENGRLVGIARGETPESDLIVNSVVFE